MELFSLLLNPITLVIVAFIVALGFISTQYDVVFEDGEDIEM
jgi:hypothetical protein